MKKDAKKARGEERIADEEIEPEHDQRAEIEDAGAQGDSQH